MKWIIGFIMIILFGLESCHHNDDEPIHFKFVNSSNKSIYYAFSYSYPDTALNRIENIPYNNGNQTSKINANDSVYIRTGVFGISQITQIFVFDAYLIENDPWDSIIAHNKVLKRFQLSVSDISNRNWTIKYP
jgi:hypothetical protein